MTPGGGERMRGSLGPGEHDSPPSKTYGNVISPINGPPTTFLLDIKVILVPIKDWVKFGMR